MAGLVKRQEHRSVSVARSRTDKRSCHPGYRRPTRGDRNTLPFTDQTDTDRPDQPGRGACSASSLAAMVEMHGEATLSAGESSWDIVKRAEEARDLERSNLIAHWMATRWTASDKRCPICTSEQWSHSAVVELRRFRFGGIAVNDMVYPVFLIICGVCGYSMPINAVVAGVVPESVNTTDDP